GLGRHPGPGPHPGCGHHPGRGRVRGHHPAGRGPAHRHPHQRRRGGEDPVTRVAVYGTGSWGTAFAMILADAGCRVTLWARRAELVEAVNTRQENPDYLPDVRLPDGIRATEDPAVAARDAEFTVLAVPSQTLRGNLDRWVPLLPADTVL